MLPVLPHLRRWCWAQPLRSNPLKETVCTVATTGSLESNTALQEMVYATYIRPAHVRRVRQQTSIDLELLKNAHTPSDHEVGGETKRRCRTQRARHSSWETIAHNEQHHDLGQSPSMRPQHVALHALVKHICAVWPAAKHATKACMDNMSRRHSQHLRSSQL